MPYNVSANQITHYKSEVKELSEKVKKLEEVLIKCDKEPLPGHLKNQIKELTKEKESN